MEHTKITQRKEFYCEIRIETEECTSDPEQIDPTF